MTIFSRQSDNNCKSILKSLILLMTFVALKSVGFSQPITFTINPKNTAQTIDNIGASGAWFSEGIGNYWAAEKKERLAELLFSKSFDKSGNPLGIGLSAWRFNIGGGTAEQGDSSGISNPVKRVECFLSPDGTYDWTKQQGYMWFVKKAARYGVENLIAFSNTPPVQYTKNGLGFKLEKDYKANLREDKYGEYADFLTTVISHFDKEGLHFNYISPGNEPQWDWSNKFGQMNQEGSPWSNEDIYRATKSLDSAITAKKLNTKILFPEAAILTDLYEGKSHASAQIQNFYATSSPRYTGGLPRVLKAVAGHSYFTENGDTALITVRKKLRDTAAAYNIPFWQAEYCMLAEGYKEGKQGKVSAMNCALFLSKVIYHDIAVGNACAWHFWNAWEPGSADFDTRYYLIALKNNAANTEGDFTITKNLWSLGHYSRFIRPGMKRIITERSDGLNDIQIAQNVMLSAFTGERQIIVVAINYTQSSKAILLQLAGANKIKGIKQYTTTAAANENMKFKKLSSIEKITLQPRSITTFVIDN